MELGWRSLELGSVIKLVTFHGIKGCEIRHRVLKW